MAKDCIVLDTVYALRELFIPLILAFIISLVPAAVYGEVRLSAQDEILKYAGMESPLPVDALIRLSLIASGTPLKDIQEWENRLQNIVDTAPKGGDPMVDGQAILEWMHENHLTRYIEKQTRLDILAAKGTYNCVSSAVLYHILARAAGIPVYGVLTPDHAFSRIILPDGSGIDVETTTAYGFNPGNRKEAVDSFTGKTGFTYVPPGNYRQREDIQDKELIALIYQNRIEALQRSGKWAETIGLARDRWELVGSESAERDFKTSLSNYSADLDSRRQYGKGLVFLVDAATSLGPDHGLEPIASALLGNGITRSLRAGKFDEARRLIGLDGLEDLIPSDFFQARYRDIDIKELEFLVREKTFGEAVPAVDKARKIGLIDESRWEEFILYLWSTEARRLSSGGTWIQGWEFLQNAPLETQSIQRWEDLENTYRQNAIITYHNRFAKTYRQGRVDEARRILEEGLAYFPGDPTLEEDIRSLNARLGE